MLRPPLVAGVATIMMSAAVVAVLALTSSVSGAGSAGGSSPPAPSPTPEDPRTGTLALTANMYAQPSRDADLVAIIPSGRDARVTGRTEDGDWLRVIYPVEGALEGWVLRGGLVAATQPDLADLPELAGAGVDADDGAAATGDSEALPDLIVASADVLPNGALEVRISNTGRAVFADRVDVRVTGIDGEPLAVVEADLTGQPLAPGRSASVYADVTITRTGHYMIEIDRDNRIHEENEFNNTLRVLLVGAGD